MTDKEHIEALEKENALLKEFYVATTKWFDGQASKPRSELPMVEFHLKLPDVETPDSGFSLTPEQAKEFIHEIRGRQQ